MHNVPADLQTSFFSRSSGSGRNDKNQPLPKKTQSTDGSIFLPDRTGFYVIAAAGELFLRVNTNGKYIQLHLITLNGDKPPEQLPFFDKGLFCWRPASLGSDGPHIAGV